MSWLAAGRYQNVEVVEIAMGSCPSKPCIDAWLGVGLAGRGRRMRAARAHPLTSLKTVVEDGRVWGIALYYPLHTHRLCLVNSIHSKQHSTVHMIHTVHNALCCRLT